MVSHADISDESLLDKRLNYLQEHFSLSEQELNVMRMIRGGHSKRRIATELLVSENTVRYYAKNLYVKLGVHNKEELLDLIGT
jgi:DNA-binding CsgD family transcriptional regulator